MLVRLRTRRWIAAAWVLLLAALADPGASWGQLPAEAPLKPAVPTAESDLTVEAAASKLKSLEENQDLDPTLKSKLTPLYKQALEQLQAVTDATARSEQNQRLTREAPTTLEQAKAELAKPVTDSKVNVPSETTLAQLQQMVSDAETELAAAQARLQELQNEPKRRADFRLEVPKQTEAAQAQKQDIEKQLDLTATSSDPPELIAATRYMLNARRKALEAAETARQSESRMFEATGELVSVQRDLAARRVTAAEEKVQALRSLVAERRRLEAEKQAQEAQLASALAHPAVRKLADENAELTEVRKTLASKIEQVTRDHERIQKQVTTLDEQFTKVKTRVEKVGATAAVGLSLRTQRDQLPDLSVHRRQIARRASEISDTYLQLIGEEEARSELATIDSQVDELLAGISGLQNEAERRSVIRAARGVLEARRQIYDSLLADRNSYFEKLVELDIMERQLISKASEYGNYCDERILWIRSTAVLGRTHLEQLGESVAWLASPSGWRNLGLALRDDSSSSPALYVLAGVVVLSLLLLQRPLRKMTAAVGEQASRSTCTSILLTVKALLWSLLMTALWPGLTGFIGLRVFASPAASDFSLAIAHGLKITAVVFLTFEFFRHVCRRKGLGEQHFDWSEQVSDVLRRNLRWLILIGLPLLFVVAATEAQPSEQINNSLGRLAFLVLMVVLGVCLFRITRPVHGVLDLALSSQPGAWWSRLARLIHWIAVAVPVALGALAFMGYYYAAQLLAWRLMVTIWLIAGTFVIYAFLLRWQLMAYRALAIRRRRERRAAEISKATVAGSSPVDPKIMDDAEFEVTLADINQQTRKAVQFGMVAVLAVGMLLVWADILPALGALRGVELWTTEVAVSSEQGSVTELRAITLLDLLLAIAIALLTLGARHHLPGLLEMLLLQRLPLDASVRYATKSVVGYAVTAAGVIVAFAMIGIGWSKVQWLVAAISVGLGFGLQEIFANLVSGLILLFERPVRVGDIVTVGDVTGHVARIRMRATTILDWDMRELVVPNREFITGRVMNWTLSSPVSRMSVNVGVAYGTDPNEVRRLLLLVASRNPHVLKQPPAHALMDGFGESTLDFVLRVYMPSRDVFLQLRHELHAEIAEEFAKAGIVIAFPQRDIHMKWDDRPDDFPEQASVRSARDRSAGTKPAAGKREALH